MLIKAIFFDLDDTLHDHQSPFSNSVKKIFPEYDQALSINSVYKKFRYFSDLLWEDYSQNVLTLEELRLQRITLALNSFGFSISKNEAIQFQLEYESALNSIEFFPEVPELIKNLKMQGFQLGIITNGPVEHQSKKIKSLGLTQYFPAELIFISDGVGAAKPNPQIFHEAAKRVDCAPENLLYIGDSWANDIVGSNSAGWQSIWYNHRNRQPETNHKPVAEIQQLLAILDVIKQENAI